MITIPKIFISTSHRESDLVIAKKFAKELEFLGYNVFLAKNNIMLGQKWNNRLERELDSCHYFLLLLSEDALNSEMVAYELNRVTELKNSKSLPIIFPIRVNLDFDYEIKDEKFRYLNSIQQVLWLNQEDTKRIIGELSTVIIENNPLLYRTQQMNSGSKGTVSLESKQFNVLEQPTGSVPLDSSFYIERKCDRECYRHLHNRYTLIRIKAPHEYGKTSLVSRLLFESRKKNYAVVSLNFKEFDSFLLKDLNLLLMEICEEIMDTLKISVQLDHRQMDLTPMKKASKYIEKILLNLDKPLVLSIDEADRLFYYPEISNEFFALIRAWQEKAKVQPLWEKLKIILAHSTDPSVAVTNMNQSPFYNVGLGVQLRAFKKEELHELSICYGLNLGESDIELLLSFVGGHPYLTREILFTINKGEESLEKIISEAYGEDSIFKEHMKRHILAINQNEESKKFIIDVLNETINNNEKIRYLLEARGIIRSGSSRPTFTCELYTKFFKQRFQL